MTGRTQQTDGDTFRAMRWQRCVLSVVAASRRTSASQGRMSFLTVAVAMDLALYVDPDGLLFRSAADVAEAVGATPNNVRDALRQLTDAGLMEVPVGIVKRSTRKRRGRTSTTYRLLMKDISYLHTGEKSETIIYPHGGNNEDAISTPMRDALFTPTGVNKEEGTTRNGAEAPLGPPAPKIIVDTEPHGEEAAGARERAPVSFDPDHDETIADPVCASENTAPAPEADTRQSVTLNDLETLAAEERAAAARPEAMAAAALSDLAWFKLSDPTFFVEDLIAGFLENDVDAATHVGEMIASSLIDIGDDARARTAWNLILQTAKDLFAAIAHDRSEYALENLRSSVRASARAEIAARREAAADDEVYFVKTAANRGSMQ